METPRRSSPATSPRFAYRGQARREHAIYTREQFGPWRCDVHVTPITGMRRQYPVFEVRAAWQRGPALDESLGPPPPTGMAAVDVFYVDQEAPDLVLTSAQAQAFAVELARRAGDLLEDGHKPDLPALARAIAKRGRY